MSLARSQRGFTMALALATAVVMGLLLMKMAPAVTAEVQRENESELIFRGEALAAALGTFQAKNGRYPTDLEELMKIRPRILRQKYKDPMTPDGEWDIITQVQPGASGNKEGLPIVGVRSKSLANGIHIYQSKELVRDWQFSAVQNLLGVPDAVGNALGNIPGLPSVPGVQPQPPAGGATTAPVAPKE
jgi:type II secretory pathway pseudopilin PulG